MALITGCCDDIDDTAAGGGTSGQVTGAAVAPPGGLTPAPGEAGLPEDETADPVADADSGEAAAFQRAREAMMGAWIGVVNEVMSRMMQPAAENDERE